MIPNPPWYHAHTEHGRLNLSASYPGPPTPALNASHIYRAARGCSPCLSPQLHWAAGHHELRRATQLLTAGEVPGQRGHWDGSRQGSTPGGLCSSPTTWWELNTNKSRAWGVLCVPPSSQRPPPCGAAVHGLQQSCGVGTGRGGVPSGTCSTTGAAHK